MKKLLFAAIIMASALTANAQSEKKCPNCTQDKKECKAEQKCDAKTAATKQVEKKAEGNCCQAEAKATAKCTKSSSKCTKSNSKCKKNCSKCKKSNSKCSKCSKCSKKTAKKSTSNKRK